MGFKYDPENDILLIKLSQESIDFAEEAGDLIVHFTKEQKPVLLEILHAKNFLGKISQTLPKDLKKNLGALPCHTV
ncbi:DUF2283 domain-containing protein [Candidatus Gottesmanbacteria bacterium]|nr:DUF2283 domain-containing protein [Candidatus Gottesmanbacteria bacterium]MBI5465643.1 DUF2283 domain-containing protein [Candidatus Gottesmanbacteria bacterium]